VTELHAPVVVLNIHFNNHSQIVAFSYENLVERFLFPDAESIRKGNPNPLPLGEIRLGDGEE
jgi:hypothetical protein